MALTSVERALGLDAVSPRRTTRSVLLFDCASVLQNGPSARSYSCCVWSTGDCCGKPLCTFCWLRALRIHKPCAASSSHISQRLF